MIGIGGIRAYFGLDPTPAKKGMKEAEDTVRRGTKRIDSDLKSLKRTAMAALSGWGLKQLGQDFIKTSMDMDAMRRSMGAAVGDMETGRREINYLRQESLKLGLSFRDQAKDYTILAAAAKGTRLEGEGIRKVWRSLQNATVSLQMTTAQTTGTVYAFRDMLSKGSVQAEELKRQLGNRLPGAFRLAADAMGLTTKELADQMKMGKIMADDFLPALAKKLDEVYGESAINASKSMRSELNRMKSAWVDFQDAFMIESGAAKGVAGFLKSLTILIQKMTYNMDTVVASAKMMLKIIGTVAAIKTFSMAITVATAALYHHNNALKVTAVLSKGLATTLKSLAGIIAAGFAGWEIGTYLQNEFKIARDAGVFMVDHLLGAWESWKAAAKITGHTIAYLFGLAANKVQENWIDSTADIKMMWYRLKEVVLNITSSIYENLYKKAKENEGTLKMLLPDKFVDGLVGGYKSLTNSSKEYANQAKKTREEIEEKRAADVKALGMMEKEKKYLENIDKIMSTYSKNRATDKEIMAELYKENEKFFSQKESQRKKAIATKMEMPLNVEMQKKELGKFVKYAEEVSKQMAAVFDAGIKAMASSLTDFVMNGKMEWKQLQDAVVRAMVNIVIQEQILKRMSAGMNLLMQAAGQAIVGAFTPGLSPGGGVPTSAPAFGTTTVQGPQTMAPIAMKSGGVISEPISGIGMKSGRSYTLGEKEAEVVLNQAQMKNLGNQGTAVSVNPIVNISTPPGTTATQQTSSDGMNIDIMITEIENRLSSNMRRGSGLGDTIQSTYGLNRQAGAYR